jgi:hypothetical protein
MQRAIPRGLAKIDFGTGLKNAFTHAVNQLMAAGVTLICAARLRSRSKRPRKFPSPKSASVRGQTDPNRNNGFCWVVRSNDTE